MEKITITIDRKTYEKLVLLKLSQKLRTFDKVLEYLIKRKH